MTVCVWWGGKCCFSVMPQAKDAIISQMQEEHAQFKAAKAAEEKRFHELRQGLERDKESLKHSLEEERSRFHAEVL